MSVLSIHIDYKSNKSELCEIGRIYDTDKSSQRDNRSDNAHRHCHPFTLFYDKLFKHRRNDKLNIAELGIWFGSSLLMWSEYFNNSNIYGFDHNMDLINKFRSTFNNNRIYLYHFDVKNKDEMSNTFSNLNVKYDIIIDDSSHLFDDQINIIEVAYQFLKPGGILIIEDIFKSYNENDYINRLSPVLKYFQNYYFVSLDHVNRISTGWDNDKLFILVRDGAEPLFNYVL
jgi:SAM-dependent methyltransferase